MDNLHNIPSFHEFKRLRKPIRNINIEHREKLNRLEKFSLWITERVGTMGFFFIIFSWTVIWLFWNIFASQDLRFDPFPAFVFWLFISNMVQLFLLPLIMIGQNLQGRHSEARTEADFEVNSRTEQEIEAVLMHLENQNNLIREILRRLDRDDKNDSSQK